MKNQARLYNVIFPIWLLILFPQTWIVVNPANLLIDFLVLVLSLHSVDKQVRNQVVRHRLWKVYLCGFAADFLAVIPMFVAMMGDFGEWWRRNIQITVYNPFATVYSFLWAAGCVVIGGVLIYLFNCHLCLGNCGLTERQKHRTALMMAIFTAPYLFLFPTMLLY